MVREHLDNLKEPRETRDNNKAKQSLENFCNVTQQKKENLFPAMLEAVRAYATLGEVMGKIKVGHGYEYDPFKEATCPF
jgi:methylmalonyl-CoA mutase N-terminal domain/subunit